MSSSKNSIQITNASEHNLKNIDVQIPHNALTVITGVSGSGKSSLAYQVLFKESQRRFLESFSSYSRQYLGKMEKPKVEEIKGLQAALAINQKTAVANPRSTVGTLSGLYDYLRMLFARLGTVHCSNCEEEINPQTDLICPHCQHQNIKIQAKLFSFNSPYGACPKCKGLGVTEQIDPKKLIADEDKSLAEGALVPTTPNGYIVYSQVRVDELNKVCLAHDFSVDIPWNELSKEQQDVVWFGSDRVKILFGKHSLESRLKWKGITAKPREEAFYKGMLPIMEEILYRDRNDNILRFASSFECSDCHGSRLRREAHQVLIQGKNISELSVLSLDELRVFLKSLKLKDQEVLDHIMKPIENRLHHLHLLGLDYLTLNRASQSLSGGEAQRIRLASQLGSGLQGILYVLDEPSIGLHASDNQKLIQVMRNLRDQGNTVVVVEHDEETIKAADYLIDMGPKAGIHGGEKLFEGPSSQLLKNPNDYPNSLTAKYLQLEEPILNRQIRNGDGYIRLSQLTKNNLKNIELQFKMGALNVVTGVSGAGKSTLVHQVLAPMLRQHQKETEFGILEMTSPISRIIEIDQSPIGRTPRSNPATYTDLFDHIRDLYAKQEASKARGYKKGRFSFNNTGGRCEVCQGAGQIQLGMHFLGNVEVICESCEGQRFNEETLEITYQGKNIFEVLELSIAEAFAFFQGENKIIKILDQLIQLDVGYLKLGQPSTTLSGGEAQRIKLASELYKSSKNHALYVLDEPSLGLHKADIEYLSKSLQKIVDHGNTVIVIEHDLDIIEQADHVIDLGPGGGVHGGHLVFQGSPLQLLKESSSKTGKVLKKKYEDEEIGPDTPPSPSKPKNIQFYGVNTHNLKNIDVEIPLHQMTVITGVSGSGKSSLAFDTIYSESRNRFTENLSSYARRMMNKVRRPEMEQCHGLTPAIAIRQDRFQKNPRSTVGTVTEIYDLYRLLYSRFGKDKNGQSTSLSASHFSFNKMEYACPHCKGMGLLTVADPQKFINSPDRPLPSGAMDGSLPGKFFGDPNGQYMHTLLQVGKELGYDYSQAYHDLTKEAKEIALHGIENREFEVEWAFKRGNRSGIHELKTSWRGLVTEFNEDFQIKKDGKRGEAYEYIISDIKCPVCQGHRLQENVLNVLINGKNITSLSDLSIDQSLLFFESFAPPQGSEQLLDQLKSKYQNLKDLGLAYLSVNRSTQSLSGGEAQRLRIASQLISDLCGMTYVLDEPTVGLHSKDTQKLMNSIKKLQDHGNTILLVEHDPEVMKMADHLIDMGPGAGSYGGEIIAQGSLQEIMKNKKSITAQYLKHPFSYPPKGRSLKKGMRLKGATANNLKDIDLDIPSQGLIAVTGVSGSGKSSLVFDVIAASFTHHKAIKCKHIEFENIQAISVMNQEAIGNSPLSNCVTYTGLFDEIRDLFAKTPLAKEKKLKKSHFSFNSKDGNCPHCKGMGQTKISLDFLSDIWVKCDVCQGRRYKEEVLEVKFQQKSMDHVLLMSISEAVSFFEHQEKIQKSLRILESVGLSYLTLGQPTSTLSGGESQRLKLAKELMKARKEKTLFLFDEPSTGLHLKDVEQLLAVFHKLVLQGHTVMVVEHHLDLIKASDWVIDLGPEGGDAGGDLVFSGKFEDFLACKSSFTADALK